MNVVEETHIWLLIGTSFALLTRNHKPIFVINKWILIRDFNSVTSLILWRILIRDFNFDTPFIVIFREINENSISSQCSEIHIRLNSFDFNIRNVNISLKILQDLISRICFRCLVYTSLKMLITQSYNNLKHAHYSRL